ncbi:MAG: MFS transporter [Candidatus Peribacteraceae bacterium]|nr:MFS transporter [Candidatus Peribacteraceae bacterium]MDD5075285.1 MFS transporter [Candidatus Peribacteraceae bacterium]
MNTPPPQKEVKRTVWLFASASFLHDMGADMIFSVWPTFLTEILGANKTVVGLIDGFGDAIVSIAQAVSGYVSDKIRKRKVFVWMGYFFGGIAKIGYSFSPTWHWVMPFRLLDRSGKMRGAPRDAIVSDLSTLSNRGRHFGILRMMDYSGAIVGIIASIILLRFMSIRTMLLISAVPSMFAVILVIFAYREKRPIAQKIFKGIRLTDLTPNLRLYIMLSAIFTLGAFSYSFLLLSAKQFGFQTGTMPVLYLLYSAVAALLSLPFGKLADRIGRKPVLFFSFSCWCIVSLLFIFTHSATVVVLAFALYGIHVASLEPVQRALAAELAPKDLVASTLGGYQMVIGLCSLPASLVAGMLWDRIGIAAPFTLSLILTVFAMFLLLFLKDGMPKRAA